MKKKIFFKIAMIVLFLILLCAVSIFFSKRVYAPEKELEDNQNQELNNEINIENELEEKTPDDETINISVIGDIMCHSTQYKDAYDSSLGDYDFSYVFDDIKQYIENTDLVIGNLETTLAGKDIGYESYPTFNTPEHIALDLKELGLDVLSTTNNHALDQGFAGISNTIDELDKVGLLHTGTYKTEEDASKLLVTEVKGIKIGIVAYSYGTNGIAVPKDNEYCINLINDEKIVSDLEKMKEENVDLIIAIMHWGIEYETSPNEEQIRLNNLLIQNGADIVLGGHPHVLQKMEKKEVTLPDGTNKDCFTAFSLGNFISGQVKEYTKQSAILNLRVTKHYENNKKISIDSTEYTPIYMFDKGKTRRYKLLDIENEINKFNNGEKNIDNSLYNTLKYELDHIYNILGEEY